MHEQQDKIYCRLKPYDQQISIWSATIFMTMTSICHSLKWETPAQLLLKRSAIYFHQIMSSAKPTQVLDLVRLPRSRPNEDISTQYTPRSEVYRHSCIYQLILLSNKLPDGIKSKEHRDFKKDKSLMQFLAQPHSEQSQLLINMFSYAY